jgi:hypothetical protein
LNCSSVGRYVLTSSISSKGEQSETPPLLDEVFDSSAVSASFAVVAMVFFYSTREFLIASFIKRSSSAVRLEC